MGLQAHYYSPSAKRIERFLNHLKKGIKYPVDLKQAENKALLKQPNWAHNQVCCQFMGSTKLNGHSVDVFKCLLYSNHIFYHLVHKDEFYWRSVDVVFSKLTYKGIYRTFWAAIYNLWGKTIDVPTEKEYKTAVEEPTKDTEGAYLDQYAAFHSDKCCNHFGHVKYGELRYGVFFCKAQNQAILTCKGLSDSFYSYGELKTKSKTFLHYQDFWVQILELTEKSLVDLANKTISDNIDKAFNDKKDPIAISPQLFQKIKEAYEPVNVGYKVTDLVPNPEPKQIDVEEVFKAQFKRVIKI